MEREDRKRKAAKLIEQGTVTIAEAAAYLGISRQAISRWVSTDVAKRARSMRARLVLDGALGPITSSPSRSINRSEGRDGRHLS